eukprot:2997131-Amphidinium_carterae.2
MTAVAMTRFPMEKMGLIVLVPSEVAGLILFSPVVLFPSFLGEKVPRAVQSSLGASRHQNLLSRRDTKNSCLVLVIDRPIADLRTTNPLLSKEGQ